MDALVFTAYEPDVTHSPSGVKTVAGTLAVQEGEVEVSFDNLVRLGVYIVGGSRDKRSPFATATGKLLRQVLRD